MFKKLCSHHIFLFLIAILMMITLASIPVSAAEDTQVLLSNSEFKVFEKFIIETDVAYNDYSDSLFGDKLEIAEKTKNRLSQELDVYTVKKDLTNLERLRLSKK